MRFSNTLSHVMIKCSIIGHVAGWSIPNDHHDKPLDSNRQKTPTTYSWEQSWKSESNHQVTTVTTSTSGIIPPGTGITQGVANTWSYRYSYSSSSSDTGRDFNSSDDGHVQTPATSPSHSNGEMPSNRSSAGAPTTSSYRKATSTSKSPSVVYIAPKPVQQTNPHTPTRKHDSAKPGVSKPQIEHSKAKPVHTATNPRYDNPAISLTQGSLGRFGNSSALHIPSAHVRGSQMKAWLDLHNSYRSQYGVGSLTWSEELVPIAKRQVDKCIWKHTHDNKFGENIAAGQTSASDVVVAWVEGPNEREIWNPQSTTPTHFTQVVWKATTQIGCASKTCHTVEGSNLPQSPVTLWACEYHPKGNVGGQYVKNVLAATGGKPLASALTSASISVDPDDPDAANAGGRSATEFF